jgi:hypothetical protein
MPLMKPPHYQGVRYNGRKVTGPVDVLNRDVEAHLAAQWVLCDEKGKPTEPKKPKRAKKGDKE